MVAIFFFFVCSLVVTFQNVIVGLKIKYKKKKTTRRVWNRRHDGWEGRLKYWNGA